MANTSYATPTEVVKALGQRIFQILDVPEADADGGYEQPVAWAANTGDDLEPELTGTFTGPNSIFTLYLTSKVDDTSATFAWAFTPDDGSTPTTGSATFTTAGPELIAFGLSAELNAAPTDTSNWDVGDLWICKTVQQSNLTAAAIATDDRILTACSAANDMFDNSVRSMYGANLPITTNNTDIIRHCINAAIYLLVSAFKKSALSEIDRVEYEDAQKFFRDCAKGLITFAFPTVNESLALGPSEAVPFGVSQTTSDAEAGSAASDQRWFRNF